ncbi:PAS domain S-box protein [Mesobacillus harenae]|uniref:PAS domain S-box protein n=1 Tax=Mesobacillus harenae TaxID=2213203 RepID=UPI00157FC30B|nr:PAS domain S-box protein [Mesobacillus harenae]
MEQTAPQESIEAIIEREKIYSQIIEESIEIIIIHADHKVLYINESGARFLGGTKEEIIGANVLDIIQEDHKEAIRQRIKKVMEENKQAELIEQTMLRLDGSPFDTEVNCKPTIFGNKPAIQSVLRDVTERREAEKKHKELLKQINDVSAPIVPALDGVYILPLVGSIDSDRAKQLLDSIPSKIQKLHVQHLIIDFSGVYNFDALVADYLLKMSTVMSLLGVKSILTGLRPELAQTVTDLGVDLSSVKKMATVQQAIKQLSLK